MRQLGANTVYTPVPWGFHEFAESKLDLTGLTNSRRDVVGFVNLGVAMNFQVVLDLAPVPLTEANLLNGGFPAWLLDKHPEIRAKNQAGEPLSGPTLAHPTCLKFVERWFKEFSRALADQQQSDGQVQVQINLRSLALDYSDHVAKVQWPIWLRKRYAEEGVENLNAAYNPPTPYQSVSQVDLTNPPQTPGFEQDAQEFINHLRAHASQAYTTILEAQGWAVAEPIDPPAHGAQIDPDPADISTSLRWSMDAPVRVDGSFQHSFWLTKEKNLRALQRSLPEQIQILYTLPTGRVSFKIDPSVSCYRLLINGKVEAVSSKSANGTAKLVYVTVDEAGETDFYFTLPTPETPLVDYLGDYLASLLAGQTQALNHSLASLKRLLEAMQPASTSPTGPSTGPVLSDAQAALAEANLALYKAAASIGALEEVFATALDKPQQVEMRLPLLAVDASTLGQVRETCQTAMSILAQAAEPDKLAPPFTVKQYKTAYTNITEAAAGAIEVLDDVLLWLRENIAGGKLSLAAWTVHAHIESILRSLVAGVIRR
jgi:hypothetical protein